MDWSTLIGLSLGLAFIRWEKREFYLPSFIKEVIVFWIFIYLLNILGDFIKSKFQLSISIPIHIPETLQLWIGGIFFFAIACTISIKGFRNLNHQKNNKDSK